MKTGVIFVFVLFSISLVYSQAELTFQNENIQARETIFAEIVTSGSFVKEILDSDIVFYEGRKEKYFDYDLLFYNGTYYFYIYPDRDGEFKIEIKNILYKNGDKLESDTLIKYFNVSTIYEFDEETNESTFQILTIKPGFAYYPNTDRIKLYNNGNSLLEFEYGKEDFEIEAGSNHEIILEPQEKLSFIKIETYKDFSIPVIYPTFDAKFESPLKKSDLRSDYESINIELIVDEKEKKTIQLFNFGDNNITDIKISSDISFVDFSKIGDIDARDVKNLTIEFDGDEAGVFNGFVYINYTSNEEDSLKIPLSILILPKGSTEEDFKNAKEIQEENCVGIGGSVIYPDDGYKCVGSARHITYGHKTEYCCLGEYVEEEEQESGNYGWVVALVILLGLGGLGYYFYKKQKNVGKDKKPEDKLKESANKFEERIGSKPPVRVNGNLTKS